MPVDKFGRMSDTKTKDTGVSLTYINDNYVRSDGKTPLTGSLDMRGNTIYNVADPVNPQDVATKVYVDNTTKNLFIDENDNIAIGLNINMEGNKIFSLPEPEQDNEPATKKYVDDLQTQNVDEKINKRKQLIAVHARYCGPLKKGEYQFKFNGANFENCEEIIREYEDFKGSITGFVMPHSGHIKKIICESLLYKSIEEVAEFLFNLISNHKKDLQLSDIPFITDFNFKYVDIEDFLKKGIDDFKKKIIETKGDIFLKRDKTFLEIDTINVNFQIVKFEKSFDSKDYLTRIGILPRIISSVLIEEMKINILKFEKKFVGMGEIQRITNNKDYFTLSEGDVINIKTIDNFEKETFPLNRWDNRRFLKGKLRNFFNTGFNYNFTFLIELDPL